MVTGTFWAKEAQDNMDAIASKKGHFFMNY